MSRSSLSRLINRRVARVGGGAHGGGAHLEAGHVEEDVGVVLRVDGDEALLPVDGGHRAGQPVLHVPEDL